MCKSQKTSTTTQQVPGYIQEGGQQLVAMGKDLAAKPFEAYTGDRVADFTGDQMTAFQSLRDLIANAPQVGPDAIATAKAASTAPASSVGTERVVDESGRLGAISDYLNPYREAALQPALRKIQEQADAQRKRIGAGATSAGAFGDARHGILEGTLGRDTSMAMGETANKGLSDAFNAAMGQRAGDLGRFIDTDKTNAALSETALNRGIAGSKATVDIAGADQQRMLENIRALLAGGTAQQGKDQAELDASFNEFMRAYGHDFSVLQALSGALQGAPYSKETTVKQPDNSGMAWAGALLGAI